MAEEVLGEKGLQYLNLFSFLGCEQSSSTIREDCDSLDKHIDEQIASKDVKGKRRRTFWISQETTNDLKEQEKEPCQLEDLALSILQLHCRRFALDVASYGAEWWVRATTLEQSQEPTTLPFHWDKDETLHETKGEYVHPLLATVTYLTSCGAPTIITPHKFPAVSQRAKWQFNTLSWPSVGKHICFPGNLLHGVVCLPKTRLIDPGGVCKKRITLMVNIWPTRHRPKEVELLPTEIRGKLSRQSVQEELENEHAQKRRKIDEGSSNPQLYLKPPRALRKNQGRLDVKRALKQQTKACESLLCDCGADGPTTRCKSTVYYPVKATRLHIGLAADSELQIEDIIPSVCANVQDGATSLESQFGIPWVEFVTRAEAAVEQCMRNQIGTIGCEITLEVDFVLRFAFSLSPLTESDLDMQVRSGGFLKIPCVQDEQDDVGKEFGASGGLCLHCVCRSKRKINVPFLM
eukprot:m.65752 g.65752  ORF g.65752 m.65752 type:complete len:463 (+) comp11759_c0_seq1:110-1498(+)